MDWLESTLIGAPGEQSARLAVAMHAAQEAGVGIMEQFQRHLAGGIQQHDKADGSPVTQADIAAEAAIRAAVEAAFPDDAILGEEHGDETGTTGWRWVIDPIDGTISFVHGVPVFGTLIGLEHEGSPVAGVMHFPGLQETAWGTDAGAFWKRGEADPIAARVSTTTELGEAMVCMTSLDYCADGAYDPWLRVHDAARRTRGWSDSHNTLLLATGRIDAVVEPELKPWDCSAVIAVLRHAGGLFTDWHGNHRNQSSVSQGVYSNTILHQQILDVLG